jgi:NAD(P)-dependent dehydrogenase (short-subunit alcohol dehydrogenase family)
LLQDKTVVMTGAASGIGAAAARVFSAHGAQLVLADIDQERGQQVAESLTKAGGQAVFVRVDVTSATDVAAMVRTAIATFGQLDCAFNNAGIDGETALLHESSQENWNEVLRVNLTGVWLCLKAEITQMLRQDGGAIVNTASAAGLVGLDLMPICAYIAAKHGVVGLTRQAALEYAAQKIRVNAICPGAVRTEMVDRILQEGIVREEDILAAQAVRRLAAPEEIAEAAAWLCSDASSFTTGHAMAVDGGWTAH